MVVTRNLPSTYYSLKITRYYHYGTLYIITMDAIVIYPDSIHAIEMEGHIITN